MKSMNKVLDILDLFINVEGNELRLSEIVRITGFNKSTVNRIVSGLLARSYLNQKEKWGKYSIGSKFLNFNPAANLRQRIREISKPYLIRLNDSTKDPVALVTWDGSACFYMEMSEPMNPFSSSPDKNSTAVPLYCTGVGKIVLANKTEQELDRYFNDINLIAATKNTMTEIPLIKKQLQSIKKENIAYEQEEYWPDRNSVASGIKNSNGDIVACLAIFGYANRLTSARMTKISLELKECSRKISKALGYKELDL